MAILRAVQSDGSPPLVMLHGGPGGPGGVRFFPPAIAQGRMNQGRDVVIYDQRGAGLSEPKLCPEYVNVGMATRDLPTREARDSLWVAGARDCVASLKAQGIDPAAYNTTTDGQDLAELRAALGYASWDVYSGSYGARLAQEIMRRDPRGVRAVVLASPVTRGPATHIEEPLSIQHALERIFAACDSQPACHDAFPGLETDFYALYADLQRSPLMVPVERNDTSETALLDGDRLIGQLRQLINRGRRRIPLLLHQLRHGDTLRAARMMVGDGVQEAAFDAQVLNNLVYCYDEYSPSYQAAADSINALVKPPFQGKGDRSDCVIWVDRFADSSEREPIHSDIPTLILAGHFDDRTPPEHARRIASTLGRAYVYELPNEAHGARPAGCHLSILTQFLKDPFHEPDASCIAAIPPVTFFTRWEEIPATTTPPPAFALPQ
ncbi:MAG TPA: alpha/beta hydrolase [Gemmatimonadales bacterium]|nr:alpha/beta hydrolase [Gemmatimonadales bacterium]